MRSFRAVFSAPFLNFLHILRTLSTIFGLNPCVRTWPRGLSVMRSYHVQSKQLFLYGAGHRRQRNSAHMTLRSGTRRAQFQAHLSNAKIWEHVVGDIHLWLAEIIGLCRMWALYDALASGCQFHWHLAWRVGYLGYLRCLQTMSFSSPRRTYIPGSEVHPSHGINPPSGGKKGGGHKNVRVSIQRKLKHKQTIPMPKLALWPRKWCVSASISNSLQPCEMKDFLARLT